MSLWFPYRRIRVAHPIPSLNGATQRLRAIVDVGLAGAGPARLSDALLDTGADDCVFPERLAQALGVDLTNAPTRTLVGLNGPPTTLRYAQLRLLLSDGQEHRDWPAWVGFTSAPLHIPTLGFAGCLQFLTATFHGEREQVELAVNALYPGT